MAKPPKLEPISLNFSNIRVALWARAIIFALAIFAFDGLVDFGTSPYALALCGITGIGLGGRLAETRLFTRGAALLTVAFWFAFLAFSEIVNYFGSFNDSFSTFVFFQHLELCLIALLIGFLLTFIFLRHRHTGTIELTILGASAIYLLSPHRDYHLDSPQFIASIAWALGISPQAALLITGGIVLSTLLFLSAFLDTAPRLQSINTDPRSIRKSRMMHASGVLFLCAVCFLLGKAIFSRYDLNKGLTTNGVGEGGEAGTSPLGFHSALGSTNQPAALVRLEGDYSQNPFTPMLYLREGALSKFNGQELVIAGGPYDGDVPNTDPAEVFTGTEDPDLNDRVSVVQSVYLLADQKVAFAVDYPISIKQLKNPDPDRFRSTFRAYSLAPTYKLDEITFAEVGDPRWSKEVSSHYIEQHPDPRYNEMALKLTGQSASPVGKIQDILAYLSAKSIYTLTPKHDTKPDEDPVAPYLFGDMRGYCVHFAHATVYMLRALGIPARIGTGFMTDLSQSKDGHLLLRMSDRHAWAEAYITGKGWVPFDIQPEQVESAAETQVDMKLLEELMGKLDPGEEILPKESPKDESSPSEDEPGLISAPSLRDIGLFILMTLCLAVIYKIFIRYAWIIPGSPRRRILWAYRSILTRLTEVGLRRNTGETLQEFRSRCAASLTLDPLLIADSIEPLKYAPSGRDWNFQGLKPSLKNAQLALATRPLWRRLTGFFDPSSFMGVR